MRNIDRNVTARYNEPFVKVFEEERELTMMLMVDISGLNGLELLKHLKEKYLLRLLLLSHFLQLKIMIR